MPEGKCRNAICKEHTAIETADAAVIECDGKVPILACVSRVALHGLCYGQTAKCVFGIGERRCGGPIARDQALGVLEGRDITIRIAFDLGYGIGNARSDVANGDCLPMPELNGRLSISVKRENAAFWRGDTGTLVPV